jgi:hypothetical protein
MATRTINGTYGSNKTETEIYVYDCRRGGSWYVCDGSTNVNFTYDELEDGVDVEEISDSDTHSVNSPITSEEELADELNS